MNSPELIHVSQHFTLAEVIHSETALKLKISNMPDTEDLITCVRTAQKMEEIRTFLNVPISVNSWYRSEVVNNAVGSKPTSQHRIGEAVDFVAPQFGTPLQICKAIISCGIPFDQLILEHTWVHISFAILSGKNKRQVLSLLNGGRYATGLTDKMGKPY